MNTPKTQRNWTATEEKSFGKWVPISLLSILLLVGLYLFFAYLRPEDEPKVFAVSVSVTEYGAILPDPAYPTWEISDEQFTRQGLKPWLNVRSEQPSVRTDIERSFESIDEELAANTMQSRDTVVVYLRGHAVAHQGKVYFLAGEFEKKDVLSSGGAVAGEKSETDDAPTSGILRSGIPFDQILDDLQRLKAANVILLADICDLATAPEIGVIANNVPELIEEAVGKLSGDRALWVITSAASLQPAHASKLRQRTLLQSACEYACKSDMKKKEDNFVSLARFYEAILRYSYYVTSERQTPLLFRSGTAGHLEDGGGNSKAWREAEAVRTIRLADMKIPDASDLEKLEPKKPEETASGKPAITLVSYVQDEKVEGATKPEGTAAPAGSDATSAEPVASSTAMRYWQLHDQLLTRQNPGGWSPVDFAGNQWRDMELEAVRLERRAQLAVSGETLGRTEEDLRRLINELEQLASAMQAGRVQSNPSNLKLLGAWNALVSDLSPNSGKLPWIDPSVIPASEQARWEPIRKGYRAYFDALSQLPKWMDHELRSQENDPSQALRGLVKAFQTIDAKLPDKDLATALEYPLDPSDLVAAQDKLNQLDTQLKRDARDALFKLQQAKSAILWSHEMALQELLQDTNLSFQDRQQLTTAYSALSAQDLSEPGENNATVNRNLKIPEMLSQPGSGGALLHLADWATILQETLRLSGYATPKDPRGDSAEELNRWGLSLVAAADTIEATTSPAMQWKRANLNDLELFKSTDPRGLIVSVSKDPTMHVTIPTSLQLPMPLACTLKRRNGGPVDRCYLKWEVLNSEEFSTSGRQLLTAFAQGSRELEPGQVHAISVAGGRAELEFITSMELSSKGEVIKVRVAIADRADAAFTDGQTVDVIPPNPDRIELYAKNIAPLQDEPSILWSATDSETGEPVLRELSVPAVGGAKSSYEFFLTNLSDKEKLVEATIYAVQSGKTVGDGRVDKSAINQTRRDIAKLKKEFVSSGPIRLPRNSQGIGRRGTTEPANGQKITLIPANAPAADATGESGGGPLQIGEFGLVCVLQEVVVDAEGAEPRALQKPPSFHWIDCVPDNPARKLASVVAPAKEGSFIIQVEVPAANWNRWQVEELRIEARLTDAQGNDIPGSGQRSALLKAGEEPARLTLSPRQLPLNPVVVHLDIGGYPRAINFQARLRGGTDVPRDASQPFLWLSQEKLVCETLDGKPIPTQTLYDTVVIPARENVDDMGDGSEISISKIVVPVQIDFPKNNRRSSAVISLGGVSKPYESDRKFRPKFEANAGNLTFSASVEDLVHEISLRNYEFSDRRTLQAVVSDAPESAKSFDIVFDQVPPQKSTVNISSTRMYLEESMDLSIAAADDDSDVRSVYFAIDRENFGQDEFDPEDELHMQAKKFGGQWMATLKASDLEKNFRPGLYKIVCRSVDFAGNIQDENTPTRFQWTGAARPVSQPKKEPVAQNPAKNPQPPPPSKHTVLVEITVGGKKPAYPEKTSISGISGASENNSGGNWIVTKVDEGDYEITASYSDAFDVKYEGKGKVKVTPTSGRRVTIDVKRTK